jgi:hypothetical protein
LKAVIAAKFGIPRARERLLEGFSSITTLSIDHVA